MTKLEKWLIELDKPNEEFVQGLLQCSPRQLVELDHELVEVEKQAKEMGLKKADFLFLLYPLRKLDAILSNKDMDYWLELRAALESFPTEDNEYMTADEIKEQELSVLDEKLHCVPDVRAIKRLLAGPVDEKLAVRLAAFQPSHILYDVFALCMPQRTYRAFLVALYGECVFRHDDLLAEPLLTSFFSSVMNDYWYGALPAKLVPLEKNDILGAAFEYGKLFSRPLWWYKNSKEKEHSFFADSSADLLVMRAAGQLCRIYRSAYAQVPYWLGDIDLYPRVMASSRFFQPALTHSNGRARIEVHRILSPEASTGHILAALAGTLVNTERAEWEVEPEDGSEMKEPQPYSCKYITHEEAVAWLFCIADGACCAYTPPAHLADIRLRVWQTLSGLVGSDWTQGHAAVLAALPDVEWVLLKPNARWFLTVLGGFWLVAINRARQELVMVAAFDQD